MNITLVFKQFKRRISLLFVMLKLLLLLFVVLILLFVYISKNNNNKYILLKHGDMEYEDLSLGIYFVPKTVSYSPETIVVNVRNDWYERKKRI